MDDLSLNNTAVKHLELGKPAASSMENTWWYSSFFFSLPYKGCPIENIELRVNMLLHARDYKFWEEKFILVKIAVIVQSKVKISQGHEVKPSKLKNGRLWETRSCFFLILQPIFLGSFLCCILSLINSYH